MMLRILLDNYHNSRILCVFANTGKETPATIDFLKNIQKQWNIQIHVVEFRATQKYLPENGGRKKGAISQRDCIGYTLKTLDNLSMNGEPFLDMVENIAIPTKAMTFCSSYLKVIPMQLFLDEHHNDIERTAVGIRYDEPSRWSLQKSREGVFFPLYEMRVKLADRDAFWNAQPFQLEQADYLGNCDLCVAKSISIKRKILKDDPGVGEWWSAIETNFNINFEYYFTVEQIAAQARLHHKKIFNPSTQYSLFESVIDAGKGCFCGD
jgi:hypothetical protein